MNDIEQAREKQRQNAEFLEAAVGVYHNTQTAILIAYEAGADSSVMRELLANAVTAAAKVADIIWRPQIMLCYGLVGPEGVDAMRAVHGDMFDSAVDDANKMYNLIEKVGSSAAMELMRTHRSLSALLKEIEGDATADNH